MKGLKTAEEVAADSPHSETGQKGETKGLWYQPLSFPADLTKGHHGSSAFANSSQPPLTHPFLLIDAFQCPEKGPHLVQAPLQESGVCLWKAYPAVLDPFWKQVGQYYK